MYDCYYGNEYVKCDKYSPNLLEKEHDTWDKYDHRNHKERENMGSGEGDVAHLKIHNTVKPSVTLPVVDTGSSNSFGSLDITYPYYNYSTYTYTNTIYKYQVRCPERGCKTFNWLELDKVTPCTNCGKKLKAVSDVPDYTIAVK